MNAEVGSRTARLAVWHYLTAVHGRIYGNSGIGFRDYMYIQRLIGRHSFHFRRYYVEYRTTGYACEDSEDDLSSGIIARRRESLSLPSGLKLF